MNAGLLTLFFDTRWGVDFFNHFRAGRGSAGEHE
jgi:hypothetical protein